jgi:hypothetical protein
MSSVSGEFSERELRMPYDNVIIFGAGASCDAGIPLLNDFVDVMWEYAVRGRSPRGAISDEDQRTLEAAERANRFAAELLMPLEFLLEDLPKYAVNDLLNDRGMQQLARHYQVSVQAMTNRLISLNFITGGSVS